MELLTAQVQTMSGGYDACPCTKYPVPCHLDEPYCSRTPYDQQLQIQTDIEYELDTSLFEGLGERPGDTALMIDPQHRATQYQETETTCQMTYQQRTCQQTGHSLLPQNYQPMTCQDNRVLPQSVDYYGQQRTVAQHPLLQNYNNQLNNMASSQPQIIMPVGDALLYAQNEDVQKRWNRHHDVVIATDVTLEGDVMRSNTSNASLGEAGQQAVHPVSNQHWQQQQQEQHHQQHTFPATQHSVDVHIPECDILEEASRCIIEDISDSEGSRPSSVNSLWTLDDDDVDLQQPCPTQQTTVPKAVQRLDFEFEQRDSNVVCSIVEPIQGQDDYTITEYRFLNYTAQEECISVDETSQQTESLGLDEDMLYLCPEDFEDVQFLTTESRSLNKATSLDRTWQMLDVTHSNTSVRFSPEHRAF